MVGLGDSFLIYKYELRDYCAVLQLPVTVQIRNITYHHVIAVEGNSVALLDQSSYVVVMTDQFLKH
jgi:hypothetical protein